MSHRAARFEIVRGDGDQPWWARFVAGNGRIVWVTENYSRRGRAMDAIMMLTDTPHSHSDGYGSDLWVHMGEACHEIRDVDERGTHT